MKPRIALAPMTAAFAHDAVIAGGGEVVELGEQPDGLIWTTPGQWDEVGPTIAKIPSINWVQLPLAGIEPMVANGGLDPARTWTCAKGTYGRPTAEHALALILACTRDLAVHARADSWAPPRATTLYGANVVVIGGGGIATELARLLTPFEVNLTAVRRNADAAVPGAQNTVGMDALHDVLPQAGVVVLALALTSETEGIFGAEELRRMRPDAYLVNVARGKHVNTEALLVALQTGQIAGAGLDVTDPEPLPEGHPLWSTPNCLITPHTANPWQHTGQPLYAALIADNVRRFAADEELIGQVDLAAGY
jgi:phosphoglycerate dehydrogenase-like enzyme